MPDLMDILFVEDDADIRLLASMALVEIGGFSVTEAENGREALSYLNTHRPDLILMDMMMPELDGMSTLKSIKAMPNLAKIPVIFMTARVQPNEIKNYIASGALGVIIKPFDPMMLVEQVNLLWKKKDE
jgi:two-component system OmpR family response regulator